MRNPPVVSLPQEALLRRLEATLDADDRAVLDALDAEQQESLRLRLAALVSIGEGASNADASKIAKVSEPSMFRLRRTWKDTRSLRGIAGMAARATRGHAKQPAHARARRLAKTMAAKPEMAAMPLKSFAREIVEAVDGEIKIGAAVTIAHDVRRDLRLGPDELLRNYAREIFLDATAISMSLRVPDADPQIAILALVVEAASGLVLSARVATETNAAAAQSEAIRDARAFLRHNRADRVRDLPTRFDAAIAPVTDVRARVLAKQLGQNLGDAHVDYIRPRRFGHRTIASLGPTLGGLRLLPGSTTRGRAERAAMRRLGREPLPPENAQLHVGKIVEDHNRDVLKRLRDAGVVPSLDASYIPGSIDAVLAKAARSIEPRSERIFA